MKWNLFKEFWNPAVVLLGIIAAAFFNVSGFQIPVAPLLLLVIVLGSFDLVKESVIALTKGEYVLDYIAILAIIVSIITGQYWVGAIIALMISSGKTLEDYGVASAKRALTNLVDRIPDQVLVTDDNRRENLKNIKDVDVGEKILIRKGEVIPLDGELVSEQGLTDESSLTGEPYEVEKIKGDLIRSGTVNIGEVIVIEVTKRQENSTYSKIIEMVKKAQGEKAPLIRLADKYSTIFTVTTLLISSAAYYISGGDLNRVLAVLVVATPCPLILATPIALLGGVNAAAKKRIIVKKLAALEILSRVNGLVFDKTGTITLGIPRVINLKNLSKLEDKKLIAIAEAIERNSLHPLAKAIVRFAKSRKAPTFHSTKTREVLGRGIEGEVGGKKYLLSKLEEERGMAIQLKSGGRILSIFEFEDQIRLESKAVIRDFIKKGFYLAVFTGDKRESAEKVVSQLGGGVELKADMKPEQKQIGIQELKDNKKIVAMVGDGINDAPALALADVGMVFSNEEQTAASEAADVVFLGGDFEHVSQVLSISKKTVKIAMQSIVWGIGISTVAMVFASIGLIPPIAGAVLQEVIDVAVIINALRTSRL